MNIYLHKGNKIETYSSENPINVLDFFHKNKLPLAATCNGNGTCGKCKVKIIGELSPLTNIETQKLSNSEIENNIRLACETIILGDCNIYYTTSNSYNYNIKTKNENSQTNKSNINNKTEIGAAIDIGSTCVEMSCFSLANGELIANTSRINPQISFGSDIVSRLTYAKNYSVTELQDAIVLALKEMLSDLPYRPDKFVITGNSVMLHFLTGINTDSFCAAPFMPNEYFGRWFDNTYIPKCISAFVGADITTAILSSKMLLSKSSFLLDIGTNGEMAYWNGNRLECCSVAAGPAFEGAGLSCGVPAISGAICKVRIENNKLLYDTIDNQAPIGICGSGIIDLIACLLKLGIIKPDGYMENNFYFDNCEVFLSPQDVRKIQFAKAAISAGISTMLKSFSKIEKFFIAGNFGGFINLDNAAYIGLLPKEIIAKIVVLGNAALLGAKEILLNPDLLKESENISDMARTLDLSTNPIFSENYIENMFFTEN